MSQDIGGTSATPLSRRSRSAKCGAELNCSTCQTPGRCYVVGDHRGAQVLCLNGNVRTERTWERHGFALTTDYRDRSFETTFGTAGLRLYTRRL